MISRFRRFLAGYREFTTAQPVYAGRHRLEDANPLTAVVDFYSSEIASGVSL